MRADRLIQIVLLLQKRHTMTAHELAEELGVSRRTIFRDMDTLCMIGIPIYSEHGSKGGFCLMENYRTSLTGLTHDELSALLAFGFPEPLGELEIGRNLKTALLKLYAAAISRPQTIYLDWTPWGFGNKPVPHLQALYRAIQDCRSVVIHYRMFGSVDIEREVTPYGLVAKAGVWYAIYAADGHLRYRRVSEFIDVRATDRQFERPQGFDLEHYWKALSMELEGEATKFKVVLRVSPSVFRWMPILRQDGLSPDKEIMPDGWIKLALCFEDFEAARKFILALGAGAEVLEPRSLRLSVQDLAMQIVRVYS